MSAMEQSTEKPCHKKWKIAAGIFLSVLVLAAGGFFWYVSDYYRAGDVALEVLASGDHLEVWDDLTSLFPSSFTDTAIIFYPSAKVEMPFYMAIFDVNAAAEVMEAFPDISHWHIAGHSMASQFVSEPPDEVDGLILLGDYLYGDYPPANTLTVYGTLNQNVEGQIDDTENVGFRGRRGSPPLSSLEPVSIPMDAPLDLKAGECSCTETHMSGHVRVTAEEAADHLEWMGDAGEREWDLDIRKLEAYHMGYGASKFFRTLNAFELFWHAEGMKTAFSGWVHLNGEEYIVRPEDCFDDADKNWGGDFTFPWVWLSSNDLVSNVTGKRLANSVFEVGGGNPKAFGIALGQKLLGQFYYEGQDYEFNFSKFWTGSRTFFDCRETDAEIHWKVVQTTFRAKMEVEISCPKAEKLLINYE